MSARTWHKDEDGAAHWVPLPPRQLAIVTPTNLTMAVDLAPPGTIICYHRGYLPYDRGSGPADEIGGPVREIEKMAILLWEIGAIELVQRRLGDFRYEYLAIKRQQKAPPRQLRFE